MTAATDKRVVWKDEDEAGGQPVGPVFVVEPGEDPYAPRPFDPDREPTRWVTLAQARAIAAEHGVELEES